MTVLHRLRKSLSTLENHASDAEAVRRRFVPLVIMGVIFLCGLVMVVTVYFVPLQPVGQQMVRHYGILVSVSSLASFLVLYGLNRRVLALNLFMTAVVLGMADIILKTSGITAPSLPFLIVIPVLATVSIGIVAGWLWTALIAAFVSALYFAPVIGLDVRNVMNSANRNIGIYIIMLASLLLAMSTVAYYEVNRRRQTRRIREEHRLAVFHARHDPLTNLYNRRYLTTRMDRQIARHPGEPFAVLYIDLNHFKPVNDRYGHHVGDALLVAVADRLRESFREEDCCSRIGGDEFCVLLQIKRLSELDDIAERVRGHIAKPIVIEGQTHAAHAAIGHASYPEDGASCDDLLRAADRRMYQAKQAGRA